MALPRYAGPFAIVLGLTALAIAWIVTPLGSLLDPGRLAAYQLAVRTWPPAPLVLVVVFVLSGPVSAPGSLMIGATVLLFGAWPGALYALVGMLASATTMYTIGHLAGRRHVDQWLARRPDSMVSTFSERLERRGLVTVALLKLTPIPFSLQNVVAGASRIGFVDFVCGTAIGLLPVIAVLAGIATHLEAWLEQPDWPRALALVGIATAFVVIAGWLGRRVLRR